MLGNPVIEHHPENDRLTTTCEISRSPLEHVRRVAVQVAENLVSVGASLEHVHVPGRAVPDSKDPGNNDQQLEAGEIEIGMGIHNEPGSQHIRTDLPGLVQVMLAQLLDEADRDRAFLRIEAEQDAVVLLVNNLGGVSALEMGAITTEVTRQLQAHHGIEPVRVLAGSYMSSLNGLGFSVTLLRIAETGLGHGKEMLALLDAPALAPAWSGTLPARVWTERWLDVDNPASEGVNNIEPSNLKSKIPNHHPLFFQ